MDFHGAYSFLNIKKITPKTHRLSTATNQQLRSECSTRELSRAAILATRALYHKEEFYESAETTIRQIQSAGKI